MKLKPYQLNDSLAKVGKSIFGLLFYGSDIGAVRHSAEQAIAFLREQDSSLDVNILTSEALKENPALLADEGASSSLFSSKRVLWLKNPPDNMLDEIDVYLIKANSDTPILIITSDSFNTKSKTVSLMNDLPNAVALGCYLQEGNELRQTISDTLRARGFTIGSDALSFLCDSLGVDKGATLSELDKLMLYKGSEKQVNLPDVVACFAGSAPTSMEELLMLALSGDVHAAQKKMTLLLEEGTSCVAIVRSFLMKINQLLKVQGLMEQGLNVDEAIKKTPPFISFKYAPLWKQIVLSWPLQFTIEAQKMTIEAERDSKSGLPDVLVLNRYLASLCQGGRKFCRFGR